MFTIAGEIDGRIAAIVWDAGELVGDSWAVALVDELVKTGETVWATSTGPAYIANVRDEEAAFLTILSIFDQGSTEILGQPPKIETDVPRGATP
jgi:hypothetical protein